MEASMLFSPIFLNTSLTLAIFFLLLISSIFSSNKNENAFIRSLKNQNVVLTIMKTLAFLASTNLLFFIINNNTNSIIYILPWLNNTNISSYITINLDQTFIFFSTAALIVTWSIVEFSIYYMHSDPFQNNFFRLLSIFLLNMLILTAANNMFLFFIGWEGVGFLSFILISWWTTRNNANNAALQAIIYNRIGDIGIIIFIASLIIISNSWDMLSLNPNSNISPWNNIILFSCLLAAIGKSAQFGLHAWLPAAMEGPTPVSALLHSSTMVVAGIFLLIRITSIFPPTNIFLNVSLIIGALTAIFAATSAFQQYDIKKIIAYSTTSQLGLMLVALSLGNPNIALFHICTHAFFKAMLFLCSGSIIHNHSNEQDLRKISNINESLPITSSCLFLGSIALMGIPFLSGFYSKDLILESIIESPQNFIAYFLIIIATFLTAAYSFRIITLCFLNTSHILPTNLTNEEKNLYWPLIRLAISSILLGWIIANCLLQLPNLIPMLSIKNTPLIVTILGASIASSLIIFSLKKNNLNIIFFINTWFFTNIIHSNIMNNINIIALTNTTRILDRGWSDNLGGQGIFIFNKNMAKQQQITQNSYIKIYFLSICLISFIILTISFYL